MQCERDVSSRLQSRRGKSLRIEVKRASVERPVVKESRCHTYEDGTGTGLDRRRQRSGSSAGSRLQEKSVDSRVADGRKSERSSLTSTNRSKIESSRRRDSSPFRRLSLDSKLAKGEALSLKKKHSSTTVIRLKWPSSHSCPSSRNDLCSTQNRGRDGGHHIHGSNQNNSSRTPNNVIEPHRCSMSDPQNASDHMQHYDSSLNYESCDSVDTSVPDTVCDKQTIEEYLATQEERHVMQIDVSESCSLFPSVASQAPKYDASEKKVDEIMQQIFKFKEKSSQHIPMEPSKRQQTKSVTDSSNYSSAEKQPMKKVLPPPPRRMTHVPTETIEELPMKLPAPQTPAANRAHLARTTLSRRRSTGDIVDNNANKPSSTLIHKGYHRSASINNSVPKHSSQTDSAIVKNMPFQTSTGGCGLYSGEVNLSGQPHGLGRMDYKDNTCCDGRWINGELFQNLEGRHCIHRF